eukprot:TRINITY_DN46287_c0_g1_i1.p2 TRINITY_DN46287_c0_g1~~TRINITY_DN46287_c0_g1_i1.p2  ORF type:complete len:111 (+),score=25.47 TRINITY_DN46287_c0_g1_i1:82-414(+)
MMRMRNVTSGFGSTRPPTNDDKPAFTGFMQPGGEASKEQAPPGSAGVPVCPTNDKPDYTTTHMLRMRNVTSGFGSTRPPTNLSLIHISEPTRLLSISYAVFCLKKKNKHM